MSPLEQDYGSRGLQCFHFKKSLDETITRGRVFVYVLL